MSVGRRFRIIKEIAEGGFGKVYLAEQISQDGFSRIVAVKLLHAKWSSHDEVVMRTRDEARLLGLIRHQHIVKVEDLTSIDGKCAIVMEYLEGCDLKWMISFLNERGMDFPRTALFEIILAVAGALDAAYNGQPLQGGDPLRVIHRDIKPSNVFVTVAGGIKVLDFGTARANFAEREAKTQALAFGSQGYMAPERMLGEEDTPAADIFSLGIALYECLALESFGRIPPRPNKFAAKVEERIAAVPLQGDPEWCEQVRDTLRLMLSYEPGDRPSAAQLVEIMELLAQDAGDMGLRRFCRTLVAEAKAALPDIDTGDPLAGQVVDEDTSIAFGASGPQGAVSSNSGPQPAPPPPPPAGLPAQQTWMPDMGAPAAPAPAAPPAQAPAPAPTANSAAPSLPTPTAAPIGASAPGTFSDDPAPKKGGMGLILGGGVALVGGGGLLVLLVVGAGAGWYFTMGPGAVPAEIGTAETPETPETPEAPEAAPEEQVASKVVSADSRDGKKLPVTLKYSDPAGGAVVVSNGTGFKAEWDGKAPFEVELQGGRYSTMITPDGGRKIRGKSITIDDGKASCVFTFDVAAKDWSGGCK